MAKLARLLTWIVLIPGIVACGPTPSNGDATGSTIFAAAWNGGTDKAESDVQVQHYDPDTLVLRQSLNTTFEAPFIYLIFGEDKVLLIDTGVAGIDLRAVVESKITEWLRVRTY